LAQALLNSTQGPNVTFRILKESAKVGVVSELVISIRHARPQDAAALSGVHDAAWREAYQGVIPDLALRKMIARRGPRWWRSAAGRSRPLVVFDIGEAIAGYASYGRCRSGPGLADGEIDELYIAPECQGIGFGRRLFKAVRNDMRDRGARRIAVWALADNDRACAFYEGLGGRSVAQTTERIGGVPLGKIAFLFD
jgi:ribosomal protein S18 acetylase RimI-like enzyme